MTLGIAEQQRIVIREHDLLGFPEVGVSAGAT
jgi:hypothetical protein